jgi:DNA-binding beta-propeller fold protein YncE
MTKEGRIIKCTEIRPGFEICSWDFFRHSSFFIRYLSPPLAILFALLTCAGCAPAARQGFAPSFSAARSVSAASPGHTLPGKQKDGSVLLPNLWSLRPVGTQIELGDFPINIAVHPSGRFAAVLHSGYGRHQIVIVDIPAARIISQQGLNQAFYGVEFSRDGNRLFCSGAGEEVIHSFQFQQGVLSDHRRILLRDLSQRGVPAGLALDYAAGRLYVANVWGHRMTRVQLVPEPRATDISIGTNNAAPSTVQVQPKADFDTAAATKRAEAGLYGVKPEDTFPYACRLDETRQLLYVTLWAQSAVAVIDVKSDKTKALWPTEEHPCEMVLTRSGKLLFVANAARNTVTVFNTESGRAIETIHAALYPNAPPGSTPNSLALTPNEKTLFVANADNNIIAVFDVSLPGRSRSLGFIPVGWYPTSVRVTPDGKRLLVANGKGLASKANPLGPRPGVSNPTNTIVEYIGGLFNGALSIIDIPREKQFLQQLAAYTAEAYRCTPLRADFGVTSVPSPHNPIPAKPGGSSPIQYCLYIIKENRTYDQVLGDMPEGNGDPKLCLFPELVTPNHHKLAREFVLLDNFYVESEVSADGHEWTMGAYATDFIEKMWPLSYGHNRPTKYPYPSEGNLAIASPARGYLWDRAREAGVSYRSYGEFFDSHNGKEPFSTRVKTLVGHIDEHYHPWDLSFPDVKRTDRFISELKRFEAEGDMPRLQILRLPNDHTHGATVGELTPKAYMGDNDLALGRLVEAVSRSKFWPRTVVFVIEDDAQNGPDHVDAHRSIAYAISPYTRHGKTDSTMYSTSSMLRTMELILGLQPMSQFDAAATPMFNAFQAEPDLRPYEALPVTVDLTERNKPTAWGGQLKMNFAKEDAVDDLLLNEVIWRSVRGGDNPMPPPKRAAFVFTHSKDEDD